MEKSHQIRGVSEVDLYVYPVSSKKITRKPGFSKLVSANSAMSE